MYKKWNLCYRVGALASFPPFLQLREKSPLRTLLSVFQSITLSEPFSPPRLSRGCNGFCNQQSSSKTNKLKQNETKPQLQCPFAIWDCFTAVGYAVSCAVSNALASDGAGTHLWLRVVVPGRALLEAWREEWCPPARELYS